MSSVVALDRLLDTRRVWRGQAVIAASASQPTGHAELDAALPGGGWPDAALSEILVAASGLGELRLLWPTLARLTASDERVVLVAPPHIPYPQAWLAAGVDLRHLNIVRATGRDALWAAEQCLRSGCCGAVLCWPKQADDRALRRLQIAAETGQTLAFAYRPLQEAANPSPAALRLTVDAEGVRILKCRGGLAPARPIATPAFAASGGH
ncbi:MAG TPA: translesion DNA synthesis-associated protein ImuA [Pseudomonas sp.]|nr:translesion DNA synthesis-associated protein ImuA [Pseudomonas sp.]